MKMSPIFLKTSIRFITVFLVTFPGVFKSAIAPSAHCHVQGPPRSWVIAVDFSSPLKEVRWYKVWRSWWPDSTPDNAITEEVLQERRCCFRRVGLRRILLKPAVPFILLQQSNEYNFEVCYPRCV
jgi:hypothetical protein